MVPGDLFLPCLLVAFALGWWAGIRLADRPWRRLLEEERSYRDRDDEFHRRLVERLCSEDPAHDQPDP